MKNYKITVSPSHSRWQVNLYALMLTPVYEKGGSVPAYQKEDWVQMSTPLLNDRAETYWGARWLAWRLKNKLNSGRVFKDAEETIYERKGNNGKS